MIPHRIIAASRIEGWRIREQDIIADNGVAARFVVGSTRLPVDGLNIETEEVVLYRNGEEFE